MNCFRCLEIGHIASDCKKEFVRKSVREDQLLAETNETHFSFYKSNERVDGNSYRFRRNLQYDKR